MKIYPKWKPFFVITQSLSIVISFLATEQALAQPRADYSARYCEVFLDKIKIRLDSNSSRFAEFYIKIDPAKLDGRPIQVGFYGKRFQFRQNEKIESPWQDYPARSFIGSSDYFQVHASEQDPGFLLSNIDGWTEYEGTFYVQTDNGIRYWANSFQDNGNFLITSFSVQKLAQITQWNPNPDIGVFPKTAEAFPEFNPYKCW